MSDQEIETKALPSHKGVKEVSSYEVGRPLCGVLPGGAIWTREEVGDPPKKGRVYYYNLFAKEGARYSLAQPFLEEKDDG